ncbi:MAG: Na+/H+ antiporter subunit D [Roseiflexaceae bacterium]|nr:Na+/H+ antiporter subunit D [Roseiflexaceae bacterium]
MDFLLMAPVLIPFVTGILMLLFWGQRDVHRILNVAGAALLLTAAIVLLDSVARHGVQATQLGNWPAPFGISFVADLFSAIMVVITGLTALAVAVYSLGGMDEARERFGYYPLLHIMFMGICGAFLTGDIFNLYVWFEVLLMSSFVLIALGGERAQLEGSIKYVTLNLLSSALFLSAVGILYGAVGTLNMANLAQQLALLDQPGMVLTLAMLFLVAFGIKAAIFPLFAWLPASYHTPPIAVSAIFAGLLTKVGVYALIRVFSLLFVQNIALTHGLILILAGLTMVSGVLGAVAQNEFRRILSFHIISQIGYMIMGLGLFTPLAMAGAVFYIIHHIIVKMNLFLVSGIVHRLRGSYELKDLGDVYKTYPWLAILFLIPAFSLAGFPPLSGFWAKLMLVQAGLQVKQYVIVAVSLIVSLLTAFSMTKIWAEAFWKQAPAPHQPNTQHLTLMVAPVVGLALVTAVIGLSAQPFFDLAQRAANQLLDPAEYIAAVQSASLALR